MSEQQPIIINNCMEQPKAPKKLPWVARWSGIIILSCLTGGFYLIIGLVLRAVLKNRG